MTLLRAIGQPTPEQQARQDLCREKGCIACRMELCDQPLPTEINHIADRGKQLGQDWTETLCSWHHRAICLPGMTERQMTLEYGPSLHRHRKFVERYGSNAERLEFQNALIGWKGEPEIYKKRTALTSSKSIPRAA